MTFSEATEIALAQLRDELESTALPTWYSHSRRHLSYWGPDKDLRTLTRMEVQAWINSRAKAGAKASTIGHERCFLSRLWRVLEDHGLDAGLQCPLLRLRMPRKQTDKYRITLEVVQQLQARLEPGDWDLVHLALLTFLRRLELFRLKPEHVLLTYQTNEAGEQILVGKLRVITSKTGKGRTVPLSEAALAIISRRLELVREQGLTYLFGGQGQNRYCAACNWCKNVWRPAIDAIGEGGQFHGLRHLGAHTAWRNGAPIESISKMMGHSRIVQTEHYLGITEDTMWAAAGAAACIIDPPAMPRPGLADPAPSTPTTPPVVLPDPEPERRPVKATDWIFQM